MSQNVGGRPRNDSGGVQASARLRSRRLDLGLTKIQVANDIGIPKGNYAYLERNFSEHLQNRHLEKLAILLSAPKEWIRTGEGELPPASERAKDPDPPLIEVFTSGNECEVAVRISMRRTEMGITKPQMAKVLEIAVNSYSYLEKRCSPKAQKRHVSAIACVLHASQDWLLYGQGTPPTVPDIKLLAAELEAQSGPQSPELRIVLSQRAKKRRKALGLKVQKCAEQIGVSEAEFSQMEYCLRAVVDQHVEDLWEGVLKVQNGWLRDPRVNETELPLAYLNGAYVKRSALATHDRIALAERAKKRRVALGMKVSECASAAGLNMANFAQNERILRKFPDIDVEAKWEAALLVPAGWLRDQTIEALPLAFPASVLIPGSAYAADAVVTWDTVSKEIRAAAAWLSRKAILRRTTEWGLLTPTEKSWAEIFSVRYGVQGEGQSTLESGGKRVGVTRERIRQIVKKMTERADGLKMPTPRLDELAVEISRLAPATVAQLDIELKHKLGEELTIQSAQRFSVEIFGRKLAKFASSPWSKNQSSLDHVLKSGSQIEDDSLIRSARSVALKMIRGSGAANIHFVCGAVSDELDTEVSIKDVKTAIEMVDGFEWLAEPDGWFWFGNDIGDNRLQNVTKKVMAAADRKVDIDEIYTAMGRSQRGYYKADDSKPFVIEAPSVILAKVLQRTPWLTRIQKNDFFANDETVLQGALSDVEAEIIKVIRANDGVAVKYEIDAHVDRTLDVTTIATANALGKSPCFVQPAKGMYSICGCDIEPHALARAASFADSLFNRGTNATIDDKGYFTFEFELSEYHTKHKFIGMPGSLSRKLSAGEYALEDQAAPAFITKRESGLILLSKMMPRLSQLNAKVGESFRLRINPERMVASLQRVQARSAQ